MKSIYSLALIILLNSCGDTSNITHDENKVDLFYQQWSINYDKDFYEKENINTNANINTNNVMNTYTGKGIKVAVIDNGFDVNQRELKNKIIATSNVDYSSLNITSDVSHNSNDNYHGTSVAGIIAANDDSQGIIGLSPNVELILIKYPSQLSDDIIIKLFDEAIKYDADIINCSWGTGSVSDTIREYINDISKNARNGKGVIVVFSSGNDNKEIGNDESSIDSVIAVGATNKNNLRTSYSDFGKQLDIVAPGGEFIGISTLDVEGINGISEGDYITYNESNQFTDKFFTGTSASAPIISAAIALALEKNYSLTSNQIKTILKYSTSLIGNNTPYLDDMINSNTQKPIITGLLGALKNSKISVRLTNNTTKTKTSIYPISVNNDNTFYSIINETLSEGSYTIELLNSQNNLQILSTDEDFTIDVNKASKSNKNIRHSHFYGYGKLDLKKFIENIPNP